MALPKSFVSALVFVAAVSLAFCTSASAKTGSLPNAVQTPTPAAVSTTVQPGQPALINDLNNQPIVLFTAPDLQSAVLFLIPRGTLVTVRSAVKQNNLAWWRVAFNDVYGYVLARIQSGPNTGDTLVPLSDSVLAPSIASLTASITGTTPATADQLLERGRAYLNRKDYDKALQDFNQAVQISPAVDTYYWRAMVREKQQETQVAIDDLSKAIGYLPNNAVLYVERGYLCQTLKSYTLALADQQRAIQISPTFAVPYVGRGNVFANTGNTTGALSDFSQALSLDPYYATAFRNRAVVYLQAGQSVQALADLNQALQVDPNYTPTYLTRAYLYVTQNQLTDALNEVNKALAIDPQNADALSERGGIYNTQGDTSDALADMTQALQLADSTSCKACIYYNIGIVYYGEGNYAKAIDNYTQAITFDPNYVNAYINRAQAYQAIGKTDLAQADLLKAQQIKQQLGES